jgi:hypothetical protein
VSRTWRGSGNHNVQHAPASLDHQLLPRIGEAEVGLIWFNMFSVRSFQESFLRSARGADIDHTDA